MSDDLIVERDGSVLRVLFNRPDQRNAMTFAMYEGLTQACELANTDEDIRVMVLRGAGDDAFVAGTDISQFRDFADAADGIAYERRITAVMTTLERVRVPTVAAVSGYCVGGGMVLAACCDIRVATTTARFGVPTARTLGMLLRARMFTAEEAASAGFVAEVCPPDELTTRVDALVDRLSRHAPLTMWAAKEAVHRLRTAGLPDGDDIVARVMDSADFHEGVASFLAKRSPKWTGR